MEGKAEPKQEKRLKDVRLSLGKRKGLRQGTSHDKAGQWQILSKHL